MLVSYFIVNQVENLRVWNVVLKIINKYLLKSISSYLLKIFDFFEDLFLGWLVRVNSHLYFQSWSYFLYYSFWLLHRIIPFHLDTLYCVKKIFSPAMQKHKSLISVTLFLLYQNKNILSGVLFKKNCLWYPRYLFLPFSSEERKEGRGRAKVWTIIHIPYVFIRNCFLKDKNPPQTSL